MYDERLNDMKKEIIASATPLPFRRLRPINNSLPRIQIVIPLIMRNLRMNGRPGDA
jgi:hypothetical protein